MFTRVSCSEVILQCAEHLMGPIVLFWKQVLSSCNSADTVNLRASETGVMGSNYVSR